MASKPWVLRFAPFENSKNARDVIVPSKIDEPLVHGDWTCTLRKQDYLNSVQMHVALSYYGSGLYVCISSTHLLPYFPEAKFNCGEIRYFDRENGPKHFPPAEWKMFWSACEKSFEQFKRSRAKELAQARRDAIKEEAKKRNVSVDVIKEERRKLREESTSVSRAKKLSAKVETLGVFSNELKRLHGEVNRLMKMLENDPGKFPLPSMSSFLKASGKLRYSLRKSLRNKK